MGNPTLHIYTSTRPSLTELGARCGESSGWTNLRDLAIDEEAVPEALPEVPEPARIAVEEAALQEIADAEIDQAAEVRGQTVILLFCRLEPNLAAGKGQGIRGLALGVASVLGLPPGEVVQVVVVKGPVEIDGLPFRELDVFVHRPFFAAAGRDRLTRGVIS